MCAGVRAERQRRGVVQILTAEPDVGEFAVVETGEVGQNPSLRSDPEGPAGDIGGG